MKHLRLFNENNLSLVYFPESKSELINFYIQNLYADDYPLDKIAYMDTSFYKEVKDIKYFTRLIPNDIPEMIFKNFKGEIHPRVDFIFYTGKENLDMIEKLYSEMSNLPTILLEEDIFCKIYLNVELDCSFINLIAYHTQLGLDDANDRRKHKHF